MTMRSLLRFALKNPEYTTLGLLGLTLVSAYGYFKTGEYADEDEISYIDNFVSRYYDLYLNQNNFLGKLTEVVHDASGSALAFALSTFSKTKGLEMFFLFPYAVSIFPETNKLIFGEIDGGYYVSEIVKDAALVGGFGLIGSFYHGFRNKSVLVNKKESLEQKTKKGEWWDKHD